MSSIPEIARTIRAEEATGSSNGVSRAASQRVDLSNEYQIRHLCRLYGSTPMEIVQAVEQVGDDMSVVQRLLRMR